MIRARTAVSATAELHHILGHDPRLPWSEWLCGSDTSCSGLTIAACQAAVRSSRSRGTAGLPSHSGLRRELPSPIRRTPCLILNHVPWHPCVLGPGRRGVRTDFVAETRESARVLSSTWTMHSIARWKLTAVIKLPRGRSRNRCRHAVDEVGRIFPRSWRRSAQRAEAVDTLGEVQQVQRVHQRQS